MRAEVDDGILTLSAAEIARRVRHGEVSAEAVARTSLDTIRAKDPELGAFLAVAESQALEAARDVDLRRAKGLSLGDLAGVPVAVKDALVTRGLPTTAGSRVLVPRGQSVPAYDATVVRRLKEADAVIVGKANLDEFAMGSSTEQSAFYPTRNPLDRARSPGGSSGGSAAAVAAGMTPVAIGSDTGGSIRQPAAFTGTVGFKPTYGRVSRYGLIAFASSLDQVGAFARDVESAALVTNVIAGHDPLDATSSTRRLDPFVPRPGASLEGVRIGVPRDLTESAAVQTGVMEGFRAALDAARDAGALVVDIALPHARFGVAAYYIIACAEASSNLARFDGVRYGATSDAKSIGELYQRTRAAGFGREVKRRILLGTFVLSAGYYDAFYVRAQKTRKLIARDFAQAFERADVVATPTTPTVAFKLGDKTADPLEMYLADVFTLPASLADLPAISVPCGRTLPTDANASDVPLPIGFQLIGPSWQDAELLSIAQALEHHLPNAAHQ